mmetsp:Transcript_18905/g.35141  ORF Transcript_18905/g.35141 Transcript_18905/m.35141 type:complete len:286 (-) Transcript_18905:210-1067(-)
MAPTPLPISQLEQCEISGHAHAGKDASKAVTWNKRALEEEFPGTVDYKAFLKRTLSVLDPYGFDPPNTIACAGVCRDEICAVPFVNEIYDIWGEAFNFSSLAGVPTLGKTGFGAALSHAPLFDGKERFVFIVMSHIGAGMHGELGKVQRDGQACESGACGALIALKNEMTSGDIHLGIDSNDVEQSLLRMRLYPAVLASGHTPSDLTLAELTKICSKAALKDTEKLIAGANMTNIDYAVFSGVQIHTPEGDVIWPSDSYVVVDGKREELEIGDCREELPPAHSAQ